MVNRRFDVSNIILKIEVVYANVKVVMRELKIWTSNMHIPQCLILCKDFSHASVNNFVRIESNCALSDGFSSFMSNIL